MIGTHDSFTGITPKYKIFKLFSWLWRTQTMSPTQQYLSGVRYFDIRIRYSKNDDWRFCHGLVEFNQEQALDNYMNLYYAEGVVRRLILERGNKEDREKFRNYIKSNTDWIYDKFDYIAIKHDWEVLYDSGRSITDYTYTPWLSGETFWANIKRMNFFSTIKKWAKKHNPTITSDMKKADNVYFVDYFNKDLIEITE